MKIRIVSAAVVLGLGLAGITLAQQGDAGGPRGDGARQRSQLAKLRAEVELLELEHRVDANHLEKLTSDVRNLDDLEAAQGPLTEQLEALKKQNPDQVVGPPGIVDDPGIDLNREIAKMARPLLDRSRKGFLAKTTELNERRLELAEAERLYDARAK